MDNGQWTMDNGQWTMDNEQWTAPYCSYFFIIERKNIPFSTAARALQWNIKH